jgi:hypothetical protein
MEMAKRSFLETTETGHGTVKEASNGGRERRKTALRTGR